MCSPVIINCMCCYDFFYTMTCLKYDFDRICRTCMSEVDLKSIFSEVSTGRVDEMIMACTSLQILQDDGLPLNICSECMEKINAAFVFKKKCEEVDQLLRSYQKDEEEQFEMVLIKSEPIKSINKPKKAKPRQQRNVISEFKCKKCDLVFENKVELSEHMKMKNHPYKKIPCKICSKMLSFRHIDSHMRIHTKERPYECNFCKKRFSMGGNLKRHIMTHTGERPHQCTICGKSFIQAVTLEIHMRVHTGEAPYVCEHCGKAFKQSKQWQTHVANRHTDSNSGGGTVARRRRPTAESRVDGEEHACGTCGKRFATKAGVDAHRKRHGEKRYLCAECGKDFATKVGFNSHRLIHTGEKRHACELCGKRFTYSSSLKVHALRHTGERPHSCPLCAKMFTQSTHMRAHLLVHSGIKPYACDICGKRFSQRGNLTVHTRTHTGETPFICAVCGKGFYDSSSLRKHCKAHADK